MYGLGFSKSARNACANVLSPRPWHSRAARQASGRRRRDLAQRLVGGVFPVKHGRFPGSGLTSKILILGHKNPPAVLPRRACSTTVRCRWPHPSYEETTLPVAAGWRGSEPCSGCTLRCRYRLATGSINLMALSISTKVFLMGAQKAANFFTGLEWFGGWQRWMGGGQITGSFPM